MKSAKYLGVWMNHSIAYLMGITDEPTITKVIESNFNKNDKEESLKKGERKMHSKEQHLMAEYYKELEKEMLNYDEILLFGPTDAKVELSNILKENHHFDQKKIVLKQTDKMTENQQHAFVKEYFTSNS